MPPLPSPPVPASESSPEDESTEDDDNSVTSLSELGPSRGGSLLLEESTSSTPNPHGLASSATFFDNAPEHLDDPPPSNTTPTVTRLKRDVQAIKSNLGPTWNSSASTSEGRTTHSGRTNKPNQDSSLNDTILLVDKDEHYHFKNRTLYAFAVNEIQPAFSDGITDPRSYNSEVDSPFSDQWEKAMMEKLESMTQHGVFTQLTSLPAGRKAIPSHWSTK